MVGVVERHTFNFLSAPPLYKRVRLPCNPEYPSGANLKRLSSRSQDQSREALNLTNRATAVAEVMISSEKRGETALEPELRTTEYERC
jgi:hypothetical protein